jgi:hypothetical protein
MIRRNRGMQSKTLLQKPRRKKVKMNLTPAYVASTRSMATRNLVNMVAVTAVSGAVLLGLLAARHFWDGQPSRMRCYGIAGSALFP